MRFLDLNFIAFGPFTNIVLDLSRGKHGLHVVYGANEAGKSAALRAMHAALFGIPGQTIDNFVHEYSKLRIGARIQNGKGEEVSFVRRKGNTATLLNPDDPQGGAYPDDILDAYLANMDSETFGRVYGIGYEELTRGGMELKAMRGLVGESLFAAGLGIAGLSKTLETLDDEARGLYAPRRITSTIRKYIKDHKEVLHEKRKAEVPTSRWEELQRSIRKTQAQRDELAGRLKSLRAESGRLDRLRQALPRAAERRQILAKLGDLGDVVALPSSYSPKTRLACQAELQHAAQRAPRLREELQGENGVRTRIVAISVPEGVLEQAELITKLHEDLGSHLKAAKDQSELRLKRDTLRAKAKAQLAELKPELPWDDVDSLRLAPDRKVAIQNMGNREKAMRERPTELQRDEANTRAELSANQVALEELDPPRDSVPLKRALSGVQKDGDLDRQLGDAEGALSASLADTEQRLDALGLWKGPLADFERLVVPLRETIDVFGRDFDSFDKQRDKLEDRERQLRKEADDSTKKIETLQRAGEVPTEEQLSQTRETRETGWRLIRADWLENNVDNKAVRNFAGDEPLADRYEESVYRSDEVADRLRREANRVAELAQHETNRAHCAERLDALALERESLNEEREARNKDWRNQWASSGINKPLSPPEMRAWLDRLNELKRVTEEARATRQGVEHLRTRVTANRNELTQCLAAAKEAEPTSDETLAALVDRCLDVAERIDDATRKRTELVDAIAKSEAELKRGAAERSQAAEDLAAWEAKWSAYMRSLGCPADATAEDANARIALIEDLFSNVGEANREDARINAIEADADQFRAEVESLAKRVAPDLVGLPAAQAAAELTARLDEARTAKVRLDHLQEEEAAKQEELEDLEATIRERTEELEALCRVARVDTHDMLEEAEKLSAEITHLRSRLKEIDEELLELGQGMTIDELVTDAQGQDADDLAARIQSIDDELGDLEKGRDEVVGGIRELENERDAIDGGSAAAEADEKALGILASMNEAAGRYIRLRLAAAVLRQRIEDHRTKTQDPLLSRASDVFAKLTCASFSGLRTDYDDNDQPVIVGNRADGSGSLGVEAMSDGTRDQLYLSLRLAYLEKLLDREEAMPFIVDDILVNFDDPRAQATLQVLSDLSRRTQVVFFTHHRHLVDIARAVLPKDDLFVHDLVPLDKTVTSDAKEH